MWIPDDVVRITVTRLGHKLNSTVLLVVEVRKEPKKRTVELQDPGEAGPSAKKRAMTASERLKERLDLVNDNIAELEELHGDMYTEQQYRAWAHMIVAGTAKQSSPPDKPFFQVGRQDKKTKENATTASSSSSETTKNASCTDHDRISTRTHFLEQMKSAKDMLDSGVLSEGQYDKLSGMIFKDLGLDH